MIPTLYLSFGKKTFKEDFEEYVIMALMGLSSAVSKFALLVWCA